ncbi:MAG TPA: hypothetical protein VGO43_09630 [Pyrinomonadaceae bacterium]|jgi:hypothetical protein|nr:hypothetical protein [Pyrinomonadaceae bacterium]
MKALLYRFAVLSCLLGTLLSHASASEKGSNKATSGTVKVIVDGRVLTGPNSTGAAGSGAPILPVAAVARAVSASLSADVSVRLVTVRRANGVEAVFDASLGQVRENGSVILTISNSLSLIIAPRADDVMLPGEIVAALLDVSIRYDVKQNAIVVESGHTTRGTTVTAQGGASFLDIYRVDGEYALTRYTSAASADMLLASIGRIGDGRFYFRANMAGTPARPRFASGSLDIERANGQRLVVGDLNSGARLQFLTGQVRGASVTAPIAGMTLTAFGGRVNSGNILSIASEAIQLRPANRFDTGVFGAAVSKASRSMILSAGAMRFSGPAGSGSVAAGSASYDGAKVRFTADAAAGNSAKGFGGAIDVSASIQATDDLGFQARYTHVGRNFVSPQHGSREAIDLSSAGVSWSPRKWLSTTMNFSTARRPGEPGRGESFVTAAAGATRGDGRTRFYISHTASRSAAFRSGAFTLVNASTEWRHIHFYANATRIKTIGPVSMNAQFGAAYALSDTQQLEVSQGFARGGMLNGQVDWRSSGLVARHLNFSAGVGYNRSANAAFTLNQRLTASLRLPRESTLAVNYLRTSTGVALVLQLKTTIFKKRNAASYLGSSIVDATRLGNIAGRVYQDNDSNGKYDATVDGPQANVVVRVDGSRYVMTDANGVYEFTAMSAGEHQVMLDLTSVRADLTMVDGDSRQLEVSGGRSSNTDFRLVRTGRIAGCVFLDANGNGRLDDGELPLADIRIATASGRDAMTDNDGSFSIADLAPGEHAVLIDEKTLPDKLSSASGSLTVKVFEGRETGGVWLAVVPTPAEVKRFGQVSSHP